jgi:hypothetical protein
MDIVFLINAIGTMSPALLVVESRTWRADATGDLSVSSARAI